MSLDETSSTASVLKKITIVSFIIFMISTYIIAMFLGPLILFFTDNGLRMATNYVQFKLFFVGLPYGIPIEMNAGFGFTLFWGIYLVAFATSYVSGEKFHKLLRRQGNYTYRDFGRNFLFAMPIITSLLCTALVTIVLLQVTFGISSGPTMVSREPNELIMFFYLTIAPVTEEAGFRLIPIGLLVVVSSLLIARRKRKINSVRQILKISLLTFLFPEKGKEAAGANSIHKLGPFRGIAIYEWIAILFTSALFGFAHYYFGAWNVGKITTSTVFGVALALAYLVYGIHAPILLHWWFNYYFEAFSQARYLSSQIPWIAVVSLLWLTVLIVGSIGWMLVSHSGQVQDWEAKKW